MSRRKDASPFDIARDDIRGRHIGFTITTVLMNKITVDDKPTGQGRAGAARRVIDAARRSLRRRAHR